MHLLAQDEVPIEFWGWADDVPFAPTPPHTARWLPRMGLPRTRFARLLRAAMWTRSALSSASAVHITDPNAVVHVPRGRLMTTVYDLIPLLHTDVGRPQNYDTYLRRLRSARAVFAISQATADDVVTALGIPRDRVVVARPGVSFVDAEHAEESPVASKFFLYVGSPDRHKNVDVLVEALRALSDIEEKLVIVGKWPDDRVADLLARADSDPALSGRIQHLGYVDDRVLLSLYRNSTAVVVPSIIEGFGLPVAEAMGAGAPVIHSRLPVLEEVSAGAALTFTATSATELAACLRKMALDPDLRHELAERGLRRARSLTWQEAVERTLAAYRRAIEAKRAG
jgi:glycosyltransferase involved in cell wall biosynthesis